MQSDKKDVDIPPPSSKRKRVTKDAPADEKDVDTPPPSSQRKRVTKDAPVPRALTPPPKKARLLSVTVGANMRVAEPIFGMAYRELVQHL
ncbi:hypothetical protein MMC07_000831 [Pseudocyphellaria aurata]|nr:hypothetical protein [Pseudocyphellaria aurata]